MCSDCRVKNAERPVTGQRLTMEVANESRQNTARRGHNVAPMVENILVQEDIPKWKLLH